MHSHPDPHRHPRWPLEPCQPSLRGNRRAHGIAGAPERHEERVSLGTHLTAAVRGINPIGWMADVAYVPSSENRSHGSTLGAKLKPFCDGTKFQYAFN